MVPYTRRALLRAATAAAAGGVAGCGQLTGTESGSSRSVSESGASIGNGQKASTNPPNVAVRADTERPPVRPPGADDKPTEAGRSAGESRRITHAVIDTAQKAGELTVSEAVDGSSVRAFVSETDFESETLYLQSVRVEECFMLLLCGISWSGDGFDTAYARRLRPYDQQCTAEKQVFESRLIRIPAAIDADDVTTYGTSVSGSGRCESGAGGGTDGDEPADGGES